MSSGPIHFQITAKDQEGHERFYTKHLKAQYANDPVARGTLWADARFGPGNWTLVGVRDRRLDWEEDSSSVEIARAWRTACQGLSLEQRRELLQRALERINKLKTE